MEYDMKQPNIRYSNFALLLLSSPMASAYYCPDMKYTGAKALPNVGHQYSLIGVCMQDPTGLGHILEHSIETATQMDNTVGPPDQPNPRM
jgi:hypothetical protein